MQPLPSHENSAGGPYYPVNGNIHGYVEFRVQLKNFSAKEQVAHLRYPGDERYGRIDRGVVVSRTVRIAGGQEVSVSLYQPPVEAANGSMEVRVEGVQDGGLVSVPGLYDSARFSTPYNPNPPSPAVLLSRSVPQDFRDRGSTKGATKSRATSRRSHLHSVPPEPLQLLRSELPVSQWSGNWLGYSCYDVILVTQKEVEQMPAQVQSAIRRYIECGGTLLVHGQQVPVAFSQGAVRNGGKGEYWSGFGRAVASRAASATDWGYTTYQMLASLPVHVYQPMQKPEDRLNLLVKRRRCRCGDCSSWYFRCLASASARSTFAALQIQAADLALVERAHDFVATCLARLPMRRFQKGGAATEKSPVSRFSTRVLYRATTIGYLSYYCP